MDKQSLAAHERTRASDACAGSRGKALQAHRRPPARQLQNRLQYLQSVKNQAQRKYVAGAEARRDPVPTFGYSSTFETSGPAGGRACERATPSAVMMAC